MLPWQNRIRTFPWPIRQGLVDGTGQKEVKKV